MQDSVIDRLNSKCVIDRWIEDTMAPGIFSFPAVLALRKDFGFDKYTVPQIFEILEALGVVEDPG